MHDEILNSLNTTALLIHLQSQEVRIDPQLAERQTNVLSSWFYQQIFNLRLCTFMTMDLCRWIGVQYSFSCIFWLPLTPKNVCDTLAAQCFISFARLSPVLFISQVSVMSLRLTERWTSTSSCHVICRVNPVTVSERTFIWEDFTLFSINIKY